LVAAKFDLPLENITWRVALGDKWLVRHWSGSLEKQDETLAVPTVSLDSQHYLQTQSSLRQARTQEARQFYDLGNTALINGDPQQARRAFESAFGLSTDDPAFNEDTRVQLQNIKLQEALVGLNARQSAVNGDAGVLGGKMRDLRNRPIPNYTQQEAKDIIDNNDAEANTAFTRLAEKIIQQQDAAINRPAGIRASIPEEGRVLTFKRAVAVDERADLNLQIDAVIASATSPSNRLIVLGATLVGFFLCALALYSWRGKNEAAG
jgi:hypothetical protein